MKIFGLYIYNKEELDKICRDKYSEGIDIGISTQDRLNRLTLNPVVHSLKELRKNTWDVERVDHAIKWLESCYEG